jgi:hypothetical protein
MNKYFLVVLFSFAIFKLQAFKIAPTLLEGYTYLPNGPITFAELKEYDSNIIKDTKNNGIVGLESKGFSIYIKKKGELEFKYFDYMNSVKTTSKHNFIDTLIQSVEIDDSLSISANYRINSDYKGNTRFVKTAQTWTKYAVKTETIAALLRKGEDLMTVYPNPCRTETSVKLDVSEELTATYFVLDGFGRKVMEGKLQDIRQEIPVELKDEASGTFVFYITIDTEIFSKKIIKLE